MAFKLVQDHFYGSEYPKSSLERQLESAVKAAGRGACVIVEDGKGGTIYRGQKVNSAPEHCRVDGVLAKHFRDGDWQDKIEKAYRTHVWGEEPKQEVVESPKWESANDDVLGTVEDYRALMNGEK